MERLTIPYDNLYATRDQCTIDRYGEADDCMACPEYCTDVAREDCDHCAIQQCFNKLAAYEDTGLTPDQIREIDRLYAELAQEVQQYRKGEKKMERLTIPDKPIEGGMRRAVIDTRAVRENAMTLYWALKKYEDTGLTPDQIREIDRLYAELAQEVQQYREIGTVEECREARDRISTKWIPVEERLPEDDRYILLSFSNFPIPGIGRYEADEEGGAFYFGDDDVSCACYGLFVNAWMPLPDPYEVAASDL